MFKRTCSRVTLVLKTNDFGGKHDRSKAAVYIKANAKSATPVEDRVNKTLWTRSDKSFKFNFFTDSPPPLLEKASPADYTEEAPARISFTGQGLEFAFNFHIPPVKSEENMDTTEIKNSSPSSNQQCVQEGMPSVLEEGVTPPEPSVQSKTKKKKKSGQKKPSNTELQQKPVKGSPREEALSAEEQLNRQLDWCIEQLELGLKSQKGAPKQKEEASRALKTLRSSKAPLVKKRQVMRAMAGDYRKKMEDEKQKQFKLIHSEIASAQVKVVADSPKKSVFHRKAEIKTQPPASEDHLPQTKPEDNQKPNPQTQEETSTFVFVPSKEDFCFNFF